MLKDKLVSPLDSRYSNKIDEINYLFSESYLNKTRLLVELNWLLYLCKKLPNNFKKLSIVNQKLINRIIDNFNQNDAKQIKKIEKKTNHDVKAIEYFIRSKFAAIKSLSPYSKYIHFGLTSEDVNSTSYALIFNEAKTIYIKIYNTYKSNYIHEQNSGKISLFLQGLMDSLLHHQHLEKS